MVISTQMPTSVTHFPQAFSSFRPRHQKVYGAICISSEGRVLLVKGRLSGKWSFPKGHMEPFESGNQCALRELFEITVDWNGSKYLGITLCPMHFAYGLGGSQIGSSLYWHQA